MAFMQRLKAMVNRGKRSESAAPERGAAGSPEEERLRSLMTDRIHYGCGKNILDDWLNTDGFFLDSYPDGSIDHDIAMKIYPVNLAGRHPFPDGYFKFGFSEDFLEHLDQAESLIFLSECYRTLQVGGVLRLSTPDLTHVLRRHFLCSDYDGAVKGREEAYAMWSHRHFYCLESLLVVAGRIGFENVTRVEFGRSEHEALRNLETREDQIDLNLIVEMTKAPPS